MTVEYLKHILEQYEDDAEVFVFCLDNFSLYPIVTGCDNNGDLQLNAI